MEDKLFQLEFFVVEYPEGKEGKEKEMARKKGGGKELTIPTKREGTAKKNPLTLTLCF